MSRKNKQIHGLDVANHAIETDNIVNIVKEISALTVQLKVNITATSQEILTVTEFIKILLKREQAHMQWYMAQHMFNPEDAHGQLYHGDVILYPVNMC